MRRLAHIDPRSLRALLAIAGLAVLASACAVGGARRAGRIDVQPGMGFTVAEPALVDDATRALFDEAILKLRTGDAEAGVALLEQVVEAAPELTVAHIDLGIGHAQAGDLDAAEKSLRTAVSLNPKHPMAHNELGIVLRKQGKFKKARDSYEKALSIYPDFHFARRNLAILCDVYLLDSGCAIKHYEIYGELVPEDEAVAMWLADLRNRKGD